MSDPQMERIGWVPILGEFEAEGSEVRFLGKRTTPAPSTEPPGSEKKEQVAFGLVLSNLTLADGDVCAEIEFEKVTEQTVCEVAVSYDPNARHLVAAGLGGETWAMFCIREYGGPRTGGQGWWDHQARGERASLKPGRIYSLQASFRGAFVSLRIDGVHVGNAEVTSPLGQARQVGLLCRGDHVITVRNFRVDANMPKAFVVMQFGSQYDDVYNDVVKEVCKSYKVNVIRADEVTGPGLIIGDIIREIATSQLIIADVTPPNPNVYFEVGYALAASKPTILLARKGTSLPFDLAGFRVLFYEDSIGGKAKLEDGLRRHLEAILSQ